MINIKNCNSKISLCMIVKDENVNLERCLKSAADYVDEIIIVDTGSDEDTIQIAKKYGAEIIKYKWNKNFSDARNKSLSCAKYPWILILDSDEELEKSSAEKIISLTEDKYAEAFTFNIIDKISSKKSNEEEKFASIRMFKNNKNYRYSGKIHEQLENVSKIKDSNLNIIHYGYIKSRVKKLDKTLRNIEILETELAENPKDPFCLFNLGNSYYVLKDMKKSEAYYKNAINYADVRLNFTSLLYRNYCLCLMELGKYSDALKWCNYTLSYYSDYPDIYYIKGQIYYETGILESSEKNFLKCITFKPELVKYTTMTGITNYMSYEYLSDIYEKMGKIKNAIKYNILILKTNFSEEQLYRLYDLLQKNKYDIDKILNFLSDNFKLSNDTLFKMLMKKASEYENKKNYKKAFQSLIEASKMHPKDNKIKVKIIEQMLKIYNSILDKEHNISKSFEIASIYKKLQLYKEGLK